MTTAKPRCRLCGGEHWNHEPHNFKETSRKFTERAGKVTPPDDRDAEIARLKARIAELEGQVVDLELQVKMRKRLQAAYMREYRKKNRATK